MTSTEDAAVSAATTSITTPTTTPMAVSPTLVMVLEGRALAARLESGLEEFGLSIRKLGILGHLRASPGASLTEVARRAQITVASVHSIIATLVEADVVSRASGGGRGRSARLELTEHGQQTMALAFGLIARLDRDVFEDGSDGWAGLGAGLRTIADERRAGGMDSTKF